MPHMHSCMLALAGCHNWVPCMKLRLPDWVVEAVVLVMVVAAVATAVAAVVLVMVVAAFALVMVVETV